MPSLHDRCVGWHLVDMPLDRVLGLTKSWPGRSHLEIGYWRWSLTAVNSLQWLKPEKSDETVHSLQSENYCEIYKYALNDGRLSGRVIRDAERRWNEY